MVAHASLIRFAETSLRPLGRTAAGVKGITLREGDTVVGLDVAHSESEDEVLVVTENGYGKRTPVENIACLIVVVKVLRLLRLRNEMVTLFVSLQLLEKKI